MFYPDCYYCNKKLIKVSKLLRKRNLKRIMQKINDCKLEKLSKEKLLEIFQGWNAYAKWANSYKLRKAVIKRIYILSTDLIY